MSVRVWAAVSVALILVAASLSAQGTPAPRPGGVVGAPAPGQPSLPRRDTTQKPATGTARIRGRVTAAPGGAPLRRVRLTLQTPAGPEFTKVVMTDAQGRYEFSGLPAGRYSLSASKAAYVGLQYGQRRPFESGTAIVLRDNETLASVDFALPRGSVISGRISDEFGEPLPQVQVEAQRFQYTPEGRRRLVTSSTATTDDRGEFRIYGLMPGEYVVSGSIRNSSSPSFVNGVLVGGNEPSDTYPPTFYPGTPNAVVAQRLSLGLAEEMSVQFGLIAGRFARLSGIARTSNGQPAYPAEVSLLPRQSAFDSGFSGSSRGTNPDGSFTVAGVAPGEYTLDVRPSFFPQPGGREAAGESGSLAVTVGGDDISGLQITTSKGALVSGRVVWEGTSERTTPLITGPLRVLASSADPSASALGFLTDPDAEGVLDDEGRFRMGGVKGQFHLDVSSSPNWILKSITVDGRDVTDVPLEMGDRASLDGVVITLTDKLTTVAGAVTDSRGAMATDYAVVIFPAEERDSIGRFFYYYIRTARPDINGRFETRGLRPGRYVAVALESLEQGRQYAPEFRQQLRRGAREFTLKEGESLTLDLRIGTGF